LNERQPEEPFNERLEWERDGQYYHYLTKWMHALHQVHRVTGQARYLRWAVELAQAAHTAFTYRPPGGGPKRMYWKMSIDLSYPLVPSMGQHDPLDGLLTYQQLAAAGAELQPEMADLAAICEGQRWATDDPLGLGGLLTDAYQVGQLIVEADLQEVDRLETVLTAAVSGLRAFASQNSLQQSAAFRLAFRELGLSIGLRAGARLQRLVEAKPAPFAAVGQLPAHLVALEQYFPLANTIERFWLDRSHRESESWLAHQEINMVMLATSLAPEGYLSLDHSGQALGSDTE
jgi:hypothetical protein